eukprot:Gb_21638 [translate_table: standard]
MLRGHAMSRSLFHPTGFAQGPKPLHTEARWNQVTHLFFVRSTLCQAMCTVGWSDGCGSGINCPLPPFYLDALCSLEGGSTTSILMHMSNPLSQRRHCADIGKTVGSSNEGLGSRREEDRGPKSKEGWWVPRLELRIFHHQGQHKLIEEIPPHPSNRQEQTHWFRSSEDVQRPLMMCSSLG